MVGNMNPEKRPVVFAVGLGPGACELLTEQAHRILSEATVVIGYQPYLTQISGMLEGKRVLPSCMGGEVDRCRQALEEALQGEIPAVVSSGDAGVYGMAGLLMELSQSEKYHGIEIVVVPGITAALSCAALVGAPFMNDFAVLSLSDLMTPAETIRRRLRAAAEVDLPVALYNPASRSRRALLLYALEVFQKAGGPHLPCALVRDAWRDGQAIRLCEIQDFPVAEVQMTSLVILGNSQTVLDMERYRLFCRRGYRDKLP